MATSYRVLSVLSRVPILFHAAPVLRTFPDRILHKQSCLHQISTVKFLKHYSNETASSDTNYPKDIEVSYDDFHHVERILPAETVPEVQEHSFYPTPSGWIPPNDEIRSKQGYLVRRTKNHMLPVYLHGKEVWGKMRHHVQIGKIEGDIWKLEAELRDFLQEKTQVKKIHTQVHEVSRCIRVRGQHIDLIADFLLERGM